MANASEAQPSLGASEEGPYAYDRIWYSSLTCELLYACEHVLVTGGLAPALLRAPRAVELPRPPQHLQVPALSGGLAGPLIPRAIALPRPLQHIQVVAAQVKFESKF